MQGIFCDPQGVQKDREESREWNWGKKRDHIDEMMWWPLPWNPNESLRWMFRQTWEQSHRIWQK